MKNVIKIILGSSAALFSFSASSAEQPIAGLLEYSCQRADAKTEVEKLSSAVNVYLDSASTQEQVKVFVTDPAFGLLYRGALNVDGVEAVINYPTAFGSEAELRIAGGSCDAKATLTVGDNQTSYICYNNGPQC